MGPIISIASIITLSPILLSTLQSLWIIPNLLAASKAPNSKQLRQIHEALVFWIIWALISPITAWFPLGGFIKLYLNIWLLWPIIEGNQGIKIPGIQLLINDYLPQWLFYVNKYLLTVVNFLLGLENLKPIQLVVNFSGLHYLFVKLQGIKDQLNVTHVNNTDTNFSNVTSLFTSLIAPVITYTYEASEDTTTALSTDDLSKQGSFDDFAIVTEKDLESSTSPNTNTNVNINITSATATSTGVHTKHGHSSSSILPKKSDSNLNASRKSSRKASNSSFSSKFGFFS